MSEVKTTVEIEVDSYYRHDFYEESILENPVRSVRRNLISLIDRGEIMELRIRASETEGFHNVLVSREVLVSLGMVAAEERSKEWWIVRKEEEKKDA